MSLSGLYSIPSQVAEVFIQHERTILFALPGTLHSTDVEQRSPGFVGSIRRRPACRDMFAPRHTGVAYKVFRNRVRHAIVNRFESGDWPRLGKLLLIVRASAPA